MMQAAIPQARCWASSRPFKSRSSGRACCLALRWSGRRHHVAREHGEEDPPQLTPPTNHHESAQIPHLSRETRRVRFRPQRLHLRRSSARGARVRRSFLVRRLVRRSVGVGGSLGEGGSEVWQGGRQGRFMRAALATFPVLLLLIQPSV
jgi:hypothetical protein